MPGPARMPLTPRQAIVLHAASDGAPVLIVAERLNTTVTQVGSRLSEGYQRLGVSNVPRSRRRAAAVVVARQRGLLPDTPIPHRPASSAADHDGKPPPPEARA
jgi:DNA-binding NarL/FixJ family response regulator